MVFIKINDNLNTVTKEDASFANFVLRVVGPDLGDDKSSLFRCRIHLGCPRWHPTKSNQGDSSHVYMKSAMFWEQNSNSWNSGRAYTNVFGIQDIADGPHITPTMATLSFCATLRKSNKV
uniref:Uncharacterized protein n=1 Tax=Lepeophtheirus salmonis TaxID=72036 RepID=A0A0K2T5F9_LEPSM